MEHRAVVKAFRGEVHEVLDVLRREVVMELDRDVAHVGLKDCKGVCVVASGHFLLPLLSRLARRSEGAEQQKRERCFALHFGSFRDNRGR